MNNDNLTATFLSSCFSCLTLIGAVAFIELHSSSSGCLVIYLFGVVEAWFAELLVVVPVALVEAIKELHISVGGKSIRALRNTHLAMVKEKNNLFRVLNLSHRCNDINKLH